MSRYYRKRFCLLKVHSTSPTIEANIIAQIPLFFLGTLYFIASFPWPLATYWWPHFEACFPWPLITCWWPHFTASFPWPLDACWWPHFMASFPCPLVTCWWPHFIASFPWTLDTCWWPHYIASFPWPLDACWWPHYLLYIVYMTTLSKTIKVKCVCMYVRDENFDKFLVQCYMSMMVMMIMMVMTRCQV